MELRFDDGAHLLPYEYLRVYSPSAEVGATAPDRRPSRPESVKSRSRASTRSAATRSPVFSDGHDSGLYSWDYLG